MKHITSFPASSCWEFNHSSMKKLFLLSSECISLLPHITSLAFHIIVVFTFLRHLKFLVCEYFNGVVSSVKEKEHPVLSTFVQSQGWDDMFMWTIKDCFTTYVSICKMHLAKTDWKREKCAKFSVKFQLHMFFEENRCAD